MFLCFSLSLSLSHHHLCPVLISFLSLSFLYSVALTFGKTRLCHECRRPASLRSEKVQAPSNPPIQDGKSLLRFFHFYLSSCMYLCTYMYVGGEVNLDYEIVPTFLCCSPKQAQSYSVVVATKLYPPFCAVPPKKHGAAPLSWQPNCTHLFVLSP